MAVRNRSREVVMPSHVWRNRSVLLYGCLWTGARRRGGGRSCGLLCRGVRFSLERCCGDISKNLGAADRSKFFSARTAAHSVAGYQKRVLDMLHPDVLCGQNDANYVKAKCVAGLLKTRYPYLRRTPELALLPPAYLSDRSSKVG